MMLKEIKHYPDTNSVEATWVDAEGRQCKCHSYSDRQMDMLQADITTFGGNPDDYADLIALVLANQKPLPVPTHNELILKQIHDLEASVTPRRLREAVRGSGKAWLEALDDQIIALRNQLQT